MLWFPTPAFIRSINDSIVAADPLDRKHGGGDQVERLVEPILESARPQTMAPDEIFRSAASLLRGLAVGHPFKGGNKRTAFIVAIAFLVANGWFLELPEGEAANYLRKLAATPPEAEIETWLRKNSRKG